MGEAGAMKAARRELIDEAKKHLLAKLGGQKLTQELIESIAQGIAEGNYAYVVAQSHGVIPATYFAWMRRGKEMWDRMTSPTDVPLEERGDIDDLFRLDPLGLQAELYYAVMVREGVMERDMVSLMFERIRQGSREWQGSLQFLGRRFPERWEKRVEVSRRGEMTIEDAAKELELLGP